MKRITIPARSNETDKQIDKFGMHRSYNLLEHAKFINNLK